jgi:hypothetical protein
MQKKFGIALVTALLAASVAAQAQGISGGMERGAAEGRRTGRRSPAGGAAAGLRYIFHEVLKIALDRGLHAGNIDTEVRIYLDGTQQPVSDGVH